MVFDVVQIVNPGAATSESPGRWFIEPHQVRESADNRAAIFNQCSNCAGVEYLVEEHESDDSPDRAMPRK